MVEGVFRATSAASANYAVTDDGTLFFLADLLESSAPLSWVDRTGRGEVIEAIPPGNYRWPEGSRFAQAELKIYSERGSMQFQGF